MKQFLTLLTCIGLLITAATTQAVVEENVFITGETCNEAGDYILSIEAIQPYIVYRSIDDGLTWENVSGVMGVGQTQFIDKGILMTGLIPYYQTRVKPDNGKRIPDGE